MKSAEIRRLFLDHFVSQHGHLEVPSASLVPSSYDPSVLLTTAGMQPFKPYFAGIQQPPASRLTSCQKCFRTPDIDQVGQTARHLTFFEMLGNFSFGDYFKAGAIPMAWELVTQGLGLDPAHLWATIHAGDPKLGLGVDTQAKEYWLQAGLPAERIVALGEDNFWKAGPVGPCGPCSELYYDRGAVHGCGSTECRPGCDCDRYLEFYNLVFMQYTRDEHGQLAELPQQNIDTGMGLERITALLQGGVSVFEIDSVQPIVSWAEQLSGLVYGDDPVATKAMRVLVDHGRGMTFLTSDGVQPSNEGRGYVLRRVIRRAIQQADRIGLYDTQRAGILAQLSGVVTEHFGDHYPELVQQRDIVVDLLTAEEERFLRTLDKGSALLIDVLSKQKAAGHQAVTGEDAFQLYDTYGFPVELTQEIASEQGFTVDSARYEELMRQQRERARAAAGGGSLPIEQAAALARSAATTAFMGYDNVELDTTVTAVEPVADSGQESPRLLIKLAQSPFYAEGGGQVADAGTITGPRGRASIEAVLRFDGDQVLVASLDGVLEVGDTVRAQVDEPARTATECNHTATHLLHAALRAELGEHVRQAGSLVEPGRLRFDFTHTSAVTADQLQAIEHAVNAHITAGEAVSWQEVSLDEAQASGAMMLFGEKYGERVRVVRVGDGWSIELCGGTHVTNTAQIRLLLITSESSVGASTRRIEALTGDAALEWLRVRAMAADAAASMLGVSADELPGRVDELHRHVRQLERELSSVRSGGAVDAALSARTEVGALQLVVYRDDQLSADELLELADRVRGQLGQHAVVLLGSAAGEKVSLVVAAGPEAVQAGIHAGNLVKQIAQHVGGGGGGRPAMARAGGKDPARLDAALELGRTAVEELVGAGARA